LIIKNLLDHDVVIRVSDNPIKEIVLPLNSGGIRLDSFNNTIPDTESGIRILQSIYIHKQQNLPPESEGILYIVPKKVAELYKDLRNDLMYPATNPRTDGACIENGNCRYVRYLRMPDHLLMKRREV
jgi:hypothetical protein